MGGFTEEDYQAWSERYHAATVAMDDREAKIEAVCDELEQNLRLLGATAIEDRLQDGVPETIADLKRAGIKIWVATGDKLETAIGESYIVHQLLRCSFAPTFVAIGRSTNLIASDSNIIIIRGGTRPVDQQMTHAIEKFFAEGEADDAVPPRRSTSSRNTDRHQIPLERINSGVSSVVGTENGDLPGGFVLVVDGAALLQVRLLNTPSITDTDWVLGVCRRRE